MLDTTHRINAGIGGARSQKTHTGGYWSMRQWGLRGGQGKIAWFIGPELDRTMVLVEKWAIGEGENPAICPAPLLLSFPRTLQELRHNPLIEMIDGTQVQCKYADPKKLTARGTSWWWWTEAATSNSVMVLVRLRGRGVQTNGPGYVDLVPEAKGWAQQAIVEAAKTEADELAAGADFKPTYNVVRLGQEMNPWVDPEETKAFKRDLRRIDPRIAAREGDGEFVPDHELLFQDVFDKSRHTFDPGHRDPLSALGLEDITPQASLRRFATERKWIVAVDVNAYPHTHLCGKIVVRKGESPMIPDNWLALWLNVLQIEGDSDTAAQALATADHGEYEHAGVVMDATSMLARHNAGGKLNETRQIRPREAYLNAGFAVIGPQRQKKRPSDFCNPEGGDSADLVKVLFKADRLLIDRTKCGLLISGLSNQLADTDGRTPLRASNTVADRTIVCMTDVARYFTWPFFDMPKPQGQGRKLEARIFG